MRRLQYIVPIGIMLLLVALIIPAILYARESARRNQSKNNLKQIGLALHNYHDTFQMFPPGGVFDAGGVPYHGWTTTIEPYGANAEWPWYMFIDGNVPWDHPKNVALFLEGGNIASWMNPSIPMIRTPDGFPLAHYAANERVMHRNSSIRILDMSTGTSPTALVGDANGNFVPLGYPYNWRDLSLGIGTSPEGFGCPFRSTTMILMVDGTVHEMSNKIDSEFAQAMVGPTSLKPTPERVAKPGEPYRLQTHDYWKHSFCRRDDHKGLTTFRLSPDGKDVVIDFGMCDLDRTTSQEWLSTFQHFVSSSSVEHVELKGRLRANELIPFLELLTLKRLTISKADIVDERDAVLATARADIVID